MRPAPGHIFRSGPGTYHLDASPPRVTVHLDISGSLLPEMSLNALAPPVSSSATGALFEQIRRSPEEC